jgi:formylglycine-generating enzyme required for sulfatase activity
MKTLLAVLLLIPAAHFAQQHQPAAYRNSLGMRMVQIPSGTFRMGDVGGDPDELPVRNIRITSSFRMSATEVTNAQYERFKPEHRLIRGMQHTSYRDDDPVVFVSWQDAVDFCKWLSKKEGKNYRLPTEAEWEYAARAGTTTRYSTGDTLPSSYLVSNHRGDGGGFWLPSPDPTKPAPLLTVDRNPANLWGLYGMHGNVEEWCADWYGRYPVAAAMDPAGPVNGDYRVTRSGSHTSEYEVHVDHADPMRRMHRYYLSSAGRMAAMPDDRNWIIGFRVAEGHAPTAFHQPASSIPRHQRQVSKTVRSKALTVTATPYFSDPVPFIIVDSQSVSDLSFFWHNHQPSVTALPNGDLLAVWYNTLRESGRELKILASRKRYGSRNWDTASLFIDIPDRNEHGTVVWSNGRDSLFHFFGLAAANTWDELALVMRYSLDNGATWSVPRFIDPKRRFQNQVIASMMRGADGVIRLTADATPESWGGTVIWTSADGGRSWTKPAEGRPTPVFREGGSGAWIAGIHAPITEPEPGRLLAFGRGDNIEGTMPMSISVDGGHTWTYHRSPFPAIGSGQRATMQRMPDGSIVFASFAKRISCPDGVGKERMVSGAYAALSTDGGRSFPHIRPLTNGQGQTKIIDAWGWQHSFNWTDSTAEPKGYLASTVDMKGDFILLTSGNEYKFNPAWIREQGKGCRLLPEK